MTPSVGSSVVDPRPGPPEGGGLFGPVHDAGPRAGESGSGAQGVQVECHVRLDRAQDCEPNPGRAALPVEQVTQFPPGHARPAGEVRG